MNPRVQIARRLQRNQERAKRAALNPTRLELVRVLKAAGFPKYQEGRNGRIGFATVVRNGWSAESVTWSEPHHVRVKYEWRGPNISASEERAAELRDNAAAQFTAIKQAIKDSGKFTIVGDSKDDIEILLKEVTA